MYWTSYRDWNGNVAGSRIRVPTNRSASAFGPAANALHLRGGSIGTIVNILPEGAAVPRYVRYAYPLTTTYAAEVRFRRDQNTALMWSAFINMHMDPHENLVLVTYPQLLMMEIEVG